MKRLFALVALLVLVAVSASFGVDAGSVAPVVSVAPATVGFLDWFKLNSTIVIGFCLALSEVLSLVPAFKGNGILDTIIKALQALSEKPST